MDSIKSFDGYVQKKFYKIKDLSINECDYISNEETIREFMLSVRGQIHLKNVSISGNLITDEMKIAIQRQVELTRSRLWVLCSVSTIGRIGKLPKFKMVPMDIIKFHHKLN